MYCRVKRKTTGDSSSWSELVPAKIGIGDFFRTSGESSSRPRGSGSILAKDLSVAPPDSS